MEKLRTRPYYVAGIILFFISHGYSEYTWLIPVGPLFLLLLGLLATAALLYFIILKTLLPDALKAGLMVAFISAVLLFCGVFQDFFKSIEQLSWLARYRYLLPAVLLSVLLVFIYLKRSKQNFSRSTLYLNVLFILLIAFDSIVIGYNLITTRIEPPVSKISLNKINAGAGSNKPDIYFLLLDEYSGSNALKSYFNYDNSSFENTLRNRGFFVASSASCDYPSTVLSMTSILTMDTLYWLKGRKQADVKDYSITKTVIRNSEVPRFLDSAGYKLYNFSPFDIGNEPQFVRFGFIPVGLKLLTTKTLPGRMIQDMGWNVVISGTGSDNALASLFREDVRESIQRMLSSTRAVAASPPGGPKFVYTHFMMPHIPFLFDSTGREMKLDYSNLEGIPEQQYDKTYVSYLVYVNKVVLELVQDIQEKTRGEAVIVLMSDHGYRGGPVKYKIDTWVNNFSAVYIPGKDYRLFNDSVSTVNQFRVVFNSLFNTGIPLMPGSR